MGYQCNFPKAVIYSSKYGSRIGFTHLQAYQLSAKITGAMKHVLAQTNIGEQILIFMCWAQMCTGIGAPILSDPRTIPYLEGQWFRALLTNLRKIKGKLLLDDPPTAL
mmetsp:Transcript_19658/g.28983  ORF Transcript_19658/g.28983 Transcript_19658/m.28983 type:complete len:108 (-) Transcript_19658:404-727(-)